MSSMKPWAKARVVVSGGSTTQETWEEALNGNQELKYGTPSGDTR